MLNRRFENTLPLGPRLFKDNPMRHRANAPRTAGFPGSRRSSFFCCNYCLSYRARQDRPYGSHHPRYRRKIFPIAFAVLPARQRTFLCDKVQRPHQKRNIACPPPASRNNTPSRGSFARDIQADEEGLPSRQAQALAGHDIYRARMSASA
jgi:hypothetical protein